MVNPKLQECQPNYPEDFFRGAFWGPLIREAARGQERKNIVVVISEGGLRGNTKYAFLTLWRLLRNENSTIELYYVGNDQEVSLLRSFGLPALSTEHEWQQTALRLLQARIALYGAHHFITEHEWFWQACLEGAVKIQLWHGIPVKKGCAEYLLRCRDYSAFTGLLHDSCSYHIAIAESQLSKDIYRANFPRAQVLALGAVRNDFLVRPELFEFNHWQLGINKHTFTHLAGEKSKGQKILLCCPTFQETPDTFDAFTHAWFSALAQLAALPGVCVAFKMHPYDQQRADSLVKRASIFCQGIGVVFIRPSEDSHPYYTLADCLITDYSSVWLDYILMKRPVVFYRPYEKLYKMHRDLIVYPPYDVTKLATPCAHPNDLVEQAKAQLQHPAHLADIKRYATAFHRNAADGMAGCRLWNLIRWIFDTGFSPTNIIQCEEEMYYERY